jgi:hypothetical protein
MLQTELADCSTVRVCVTRWGVCRALLVLYLACYLACAGTLSNELWSRGGHATPEQWSYHLLLVRLGIPHHHEFEAETQGEGRDAPGSDASLLRLSLPVISAPLAMPFTSGGALLIIAPALAELVFPTVHRRLAPHVVRLRQQGLRPAPLERPPALHA